VKDEILLLHEDVLRQFEAQAGQPRVNAHVAQLWRFRLASNTPYPASVGTSASCNLPNRASTQPSG